MTGHDDERGARPEHGQLQTIGRGQRQARGERAGIERDQRETRTSHEQIGGTQRAIGAAAAAHPQHARQLEAGALGSAGIEDVIGVDERGERAPPCDLAQARDEQARTARRGPTEDLCDSAFHDQFRGPHDLLLIT